MATETPTLDESAVQLVWNGITSSERLHRYYSKLGERFALFNRISLTLIGLLSLLAASLLFAALPSVIWWLPGVPAFLVAGLSVWISYADYSRKAGISTGIASLCMDLARDWQSLWFDIYADDVRERAFSLDQQENRITSPALWSQGFWNAKIHEQSEREAYDYCIRAYNYT